MELIATTRPPVAYAYGAYPVQDGARLRCGLLFVKAGSQHRTLTLRDPESKQRFRVRLPDTAIKAKGTARFTRLELEVI